MPSDHYFSQRPSSPAEQRPLEVHLAGRDVSLVTASGIFSPDHVDQGTRVLLGAMPAPPAGDLLDLGCGWGPIALSLALQAPGSRVWAVDVNDRAIDLVRVNAERLGLTNVNACRPEDVPADVRFASIRSNPPIRVGKEVLHGMLEQWLPRLADGGDAWLVVQRNLGSDSLHRWLADAGWDVERVTSEKGFRVLRVRAPG
ncbi:class I SAM-dependent methyltransferase [Agromyces archimandritae]|uniref:Class I SAM-dependent methyltransferase n=1 Tax=Agromyces archimandritae TaxID=2781962 RepID=A0A975INW6_9MICO|nr:methyltransferase [Agromyces archimandritae]QTX05017.1 class I SAM-dependent methyltransferase [Agromyces archimandritae]